jgi:hypothetical protein
MSTPESIFDQVAQTTIHEQALHASAPQPEIPEIYRTVDVEFWSGLSVDQRDAVKRMQQKFGEHSNMLAKAKAEPEVVEKDDALMALAMPRFVAGGFMMGTGFLAATLSILDMLGPLVLWFGLPIGLFGLILSLDRRN